MTASFLDLLGAIYTRVPSRYRPAIKRSVYWSLLRGQSAASLRRIHRGKRVEFIDFEVAWLEDFEFLGPGAGEVLVETSATTVSPGTETAVLCGLPGARRRFPYQPGYSWAGTVREVGRKVPAYHPGDRLAGRVKHTSHDVVRPESLFRIPEGVSFEDASFIELGIIVLQGIRKAAIRPGESVAVVGQGLIGQMANRFARALGASRVVAVASSRNRETVALRGRGAHEFVSLRDEPDAGPRVAADVVIEAVGSPGAIAGSMEFARSGGRLILLGSSRGLGRNVELRRAAQERDLEIVGAHVSDMPERDSAPRRWTYRQEGELFLRMLAEGTVAVSDLVTWRPRPSECNAVFECLAAGGRGHVGIVFDWRNGEAGS